MCGKQTASVPHSESCFRAVIGQSHMPASAPFPPSPLGSRLRLLEGINRVACPRAKQANQPIPVPDQPQCNQFPIHSPQGRVSRCICPPLPLFDVGGRSSNGSGSSREWLKMNGGWFVGFVVPTPAVVATCQRNDETAFRLVDRSTNGQTDDQHRIWRQLNISPGRHSYWLV